MKQLDKQQTEAVTGARKRSAMTTLAIGEEDGTVTTLAIGEEGGRCFTTFKVGEEGPVYTTLALGEEDGGASVSGGASALGSF